MHDEFISLVIKTNYFVADFAEKLMAYSFGIVSNDMNYKTKDVEIYLKSFWSSFGEISTLWEYLNLVDKYEFNDTIQETIRIINSADVSQSIGTKNLVKVIDTMAYARSKHYDELDLLPRLNIKENVPNDFIGEGISSFYKKYLIGIEKYDGSIRFFDMDAFEMRVYFNDIPKEENLDFFIKRIKDFFCKKYLKVVEDYNCFLNNKSLDGYTYLDDLELNSLTLEEKGNIIKRYI